MSLKGINQFFELALLIFLLIIDCDCQRRAPRGIKDLRQLLKNKLPTEIGKCDFEEVCDWEWGVGFKKVHAQDGIPHGPTTDANNRINGQYLWITGNSDAHLWSKIIPRTGSLCVLELAIYQVNMLNGQIILIIQTDNDTKYVAVERPGNNNARWETISINLSPISNPYKLILEFKMPFVNSSVAVDNIKLNNCFPDSRTVIHGNCTEKMFRCKNGSCLSRDHVCDLTPDCASGEDETWECDKIPEYARCSFESGWCGWVNETQRLLNWTLLQGPVLTERNGPVSDHTYRNSTGHYAIVDLSKIKEYGARATMKSQVFNPTPPYHSDPQSPYVNSCKLRFFYHQSGSHTGPLGLYLVQIQQHQNHSERIWWSGKGSNDAFWYNKEIILPEVKHRYYLEFEVSRNYASKGSIAIDDVSLSPECFGIGVPLEVLGDFNYYDQKVEYFTPTKHQDFVNESLIEITTCGNTGRFGPSPFICHEYHNSTNVELVSEDESDLVLPFKGVQKWTAQRGGYYTLIAIGASGGKGSLSTGISMGAAVRGIIELEKGQSLYFMVGQKGTDACPKNFGLQKSLCHLPNSTDAFDTSLTNQSLSAVVRKIKKTELRDGGGGGGGATYIFTLKPNGEQHPLLIGGGGGGLGFGQFIDDGNQHGKGEAPNGLTANIGFSLKANSGGIGASFLSNGFINNFNDTMDTPHGTPLTKGGIGGIGCADNRLGHGDGGFGGGGGGCLSGGGGGGYIGGSTGHQESGNGEGGYSYVAPELLHISYQMKANVGPGEAYIIPAISGCNCDFRCVAVDQHLSETKCLCPVGWQLADDFKTCLMAEDNDSTRQTFMIILIIVSFILLFAFSGLCVLLYNRYQSRKALLKRRQVMFGNGTELTSLRVVSDNMMTEFNPNYEFAGNLYSFKDLPQIPRDSISLVKPLGQGAFGEVYQGSYRYQKNEEHLVAVKTLPSLSTSQAEADFVMEALIMSKFNHPNIVHFIGISFDKHPRYIVLELLAGGDLKNFLREERPRPDQPTNLNMQSLVLCAYDVAKGCKYMEDARFIHRDIAARNCLLTCKGPGRVVKIADFGMARDIYRSDYYRKGGKAMLPIKWMPPESFLDGIFTTKTDVWAFGVLLWEIMSFGYMPYTGCSNREVMQMVTSGGRLEKPAGCPDPVYGIMTKCWHPHPDDRPSFSTIVERIGYCLQDPDVINHPTPNFESLPACDRETTIMRPDPETECINVHADLDGHGYMQPRFDAGKTPVRSQHPVIPGVVYASLKHDGTQNAPEKRPDFIEPPTEYKTISHTLNNPENKWNSTGHNIYNENQEESTLSPISQEDTSSSSPTTRTSSPHETHRNGSNGNVNGIKKNALKVVLSLDPSALGSEKVPYEKVAFSMQKTGSNNSAEDKSESSEHGIHQQRKEECSC